MINTDDSDASRQPEIQVQQYIYKNVYSVLIELVY